MRRGYVLLCLAAACSGGSHHPGDATSDVAIVGCGDGVKGAGEQCDGNDLGSASCSTAASPGWVGVVSCTQMCELDIAGCNPPATTWSTISDPSNWSTFDVGTLYPGAKGFVSSAYDGRYLYLVPSDNGTAADGVVARFDTQGGFGSSGSWATFDVSTVTATAKGFAGAAFDGRYIYLIPYNNGAYNGVIARYDTQSTGGFGASASWSTFDIATVNPDARGYQRAAFDGRYLYLAPHYNGVYHGIAARYDTQGAFADAGSWTTFDASTANPGSKGFLGVEFDGRYVYYVPYFNQTVYDGLVTRYDTQATGGFTAAASWSTFNLQTVNANAVGFWGTAFDGRYLYMAQYYDGVAVIPNYGGLAARYDTQAAFGSAASWSTIDLTTVNASSRGFIGAGFDGRYIYLSPYYDNAVYDGVVTRFDTEAAGGFATPASWGTFDVSTLNPNAKGFEGVGFDGQYIYLVPTYNGVYHGTVARFNAKTPSWLPKDWFHAFD